MLPDMMLVATGMAMAFKLRGEARCALTWFGDGSTSRGDFHEAMNWAGVQKLPVIFVLENNQYAYSTPIEPAVRGRPRAARDGLRLPRRQRRRQRRRGDVRGDARRARAGDRRRRPDADRGGHDAHARPRRARRHEVRPEGARRGVAQEGPDRPPERAASRRSATTSRRCARRSRRVVDEATEVALAGPMPAPDDRDRPRLLPGDAPEILLERRRRAVERLSAHERDDLPAGDLRRPARRRCAATSASC